MISRIERLPTRLQALDTKLFEHLVHAPEDELHSLVVSAGVVRLHLDGALEIVDDRDEAFQQTRLCDG